MTRNLWRVLLALVLIGSVVFLVIMQDRSNSERVLPSPGSLPAVPDAEAARESEQPLPPSAESERTELVAEAKASPTVEVAPPVSSLATIRGRILFEGGAPASGAQLQVRGWQSSSELVLEYGEPEDWEDPSAQSGPDGQFEIALDPPLAYQFTLEASYSGYAGAKWRWYHIDPGSVVDVGDVVLVRGGSIVGKVADREGRPPPGQWQIQSDAAPTSLQEGRDETREYGIVDRATGEFRILDMPPGPARLRARDQGSNRSIEGPTVDVRAGEEVEANLLYEGPSLHEGSTGSATITVKPRCEQFHPFSYRVDEVQLMRSGVEIARVQPSDRSGMSFVFNEVEAGEYEVVIEDQKFERWSKSGVRPGQEVRAELVGNSGIQLRVIDALTGMAVPHYQADLVFVFRGNYSFNPRTFRLQEADTEPPTDGVFSGLIPHDSALVITSASYAPARIPVDALAPFERRTLVASLEKGTTLAVQVLHADGQAASAVSVELLEGLLEEKDLNDPRAARRLRGEGKPRIEDTDEAGRCAFGDVLRGTWTLLATSGPARAAVTVSVPPAPAGELELRFPLLGSLDGVVHGPKSILGSLRLVVRESSDARERHGDEDGLVSKLDEDGRFHVGPLTPGEWVASVELPLFSDDAEDYEAGGHVELERLQILGGERLEREYQLGDHIPGSLRLTISTNGSPAIGVVAMIHRVQTDGSVERDAEAMRMVGSGSGLLGPVFPGTWRAVVHDMGERWSYAHPTAVVVESSQETSISVAVELVSGTLEIHETGSGEPLAGGITWEAKSQGMALKGRLESDPKGIAQVMLPPGEYLLSTPLSDPVVLNWSSSGPVPAVIELPKFVPPGSKR